ncbi:MAG: WD40 repeat domain-containing protein [Cyclobacteriaceae bacterium]
MLKHLFLIVFAGSLLTSSCQSGKNSKPPKEDWWFWDVAYSPDASQIAMGGTQDTLRIYSVGEKTLRNIPATGTITKIKWHPSGDRIAVAMQNSVQPSRIYFPSTEKTILLDSLDLTGARGIEWNYDGSLLATGDYSGNINIFDVDGKWLRMIKTKTKSVTDLDWHPTENKLVTVGEKICIYDYEQDSVYSFEDRDEDVLMLSVAWHPSGEFFSTGDYGDYDYDYPPLLQFWDINGTRLCKSYDNENLAELRNLDWSPDGELLASASDQVRIWWYQDCTRFGEQTVGKLLWGVNWHPDGHQLVITDEKGGVWIVSREMSVTDDIVYW